MTTMDNFAAKYGSFFLIRFLCSVIYCLISALISVYSESVRYW